MVFIAGCLFNIRAQQVAPDDKEAGSRLEALKVAWLTKKLNLSVEEAQRFWPVYNQYIAELRKIRIENRGNNASEIDTDEKILNIRKRYNAEFSKALSSEKTNNFFRYEKEFRSAIQRELQDRRMSRQQQIRRPATKQ